MKRVLVSVSDKTNLVPFVKGLVEVGYEVISTGGTKNGAFDQIKYELYLHTNYQKTLSITALPAFYLEPNSRVNINDKSTNTYGDYMITSITIPLGPGNLMSVSCSEIFERF